MLDHFHLFSPMQFVDFIMEKTNNYWTQEVNNNTFRSKIRTRSTPASCSPVRWQSVQASETVVSKGLNIDSIVFCLIFLRPAGHWKHTVIRFPSSSLYHFSSDAKNM